MKTRLTILPLIIVFAVYAFTQEASAYNGRQKASKEKSKTNSFIFQLHNSSGNNVLVDSALIILDKYDLTGAGAVISVIALDNKNRLTLTDVPAGKYYADIYTYGVRRQHISAVIKVKTHGKKLKPNYTKIKIADIEQYIKSEIVIPPENPKLFTYVKF